MKIKFSINALFFLNLITLLFIIEPVKAAYLWSNQNKPLSFWNSSEEFAHCWVTEQGLMIQRAENVDQAYQSRSLIQTTLKDSISIKDYNLLRLKLGGIKIHSLYQKDTAASTLLNPLRLAWISDRDSVWNAEKSLEFNLVREPGWEVNFVGVAFLGQLMSWQENQDQLLTSLKIEIPKEIQEASIPKIELIYDPILALMGSTWSGIPKRYIILATFSVVLLFFLVRRFAGYHLESSLNHKYILYGFIVFLIISALIPLDFYPYLRCSIFFWQLTLPILWLLLLIIIYFISCRNLKQLKLALQLKGLEWTWLLFIFLALLSFTASVEISESWHHFLYYLLIPALILFLVSRILDSYKNVKLLYHSIAAISLLVALYSLLEFMSGRNFLFQNFLLLYAPFFYSTANHRISSSLIYPTTLALFLLLTTAYFFYLAKFQVGKIRVYGYLGAMVLPLSIILTQSKGGFIGLVVLILVWWSFYNPKFIGVLTLVGLLSVLLVAFVKYADYQNYLENAGRTRQEHLLRGIEKSRDLVTNSLSVLSEEEKKAALVQLNHPILFSIAQRWQGFKVAGRIIKSNPLLGIGLNNYPKRYLEFTKDSDLEFTDSPDNIYLRIAAETGLLGFFAFAATIALSFLILIRAQRQPLAESRRGLLQSLLAGQSGFCANLFFFDGIYWFTPAMFFWSFTALSWCASNLVKED